MDVRQWRPGRDARAPRAIAGSSQLAQQRPLLSVNPSALCAQSALSMCSDTRSCADRRASLPAVRACPPVGAAAARERPAGADSPYAASLVWHSRCTASRGMCCPGRRLVRERESCVSGIVRGAVMPWLGRRDGAGSMAPQRPLVTLLTEAAAGTSVSAERSRAAITGAPA
jgi:hypothetical protein